MEWATLAKVPLVVIRGAGDLASGVAYRLFWAGYPVVMTELDRPTVVRRAVSFGSAIYESPFAVEGVTARQMEASSALWLSLQADEIPVLIDADNTWRDLLPLVVIDARMAKTNLDTTIDDAPLVIALGPGFIAGQDCDAVIETNRGHHLGRVIWHGAAEPNTGSPGTVLGHSKERVLRAPADGYVVASIQIGDWVEAGDLIATVCDQEILAPFAGRLRGIVHPDVPVTEGMKIGDLDPRGVLEHCFTISDKALAIGGGVLMAILQAGIHPLPQHHFAGRQDDAAD